MKALLTALDLWEIVERGYIIPESLTGQQLTTEQQSLVKEKTTNNAKATAYLHSSIGETIFPRIINTTSAKELWDTLQEDFHGSKKEEKENFHLVKYAIKQTTWRKIAGIKIKYHIIFAKGLAMNKDCWYKDQQAKANVSESGMFEDQLFVACQSSIGTNKDVWLIDSGCTNHMANNECMFIDIDTSMYTPVRMRDGSITEAKGKGTIAVQTKKGARYIKNVLFVPNLASNLLSVPKMMQNGYSINFEGNSCNIYDQQGKEIAQVQIQNKSFPLLWKNPKEEVNRMEHDDSRLWHKRLGHYNFHALELLHRKNMLRDLPLVTLQK
ncbi:uncharacterized protein [Spinacia oleracea]|uniref:GAG-pre-integrase domain-containing protein n=1 Tax=Spinacia oleracea TaxID=3562 RepID=A0ABM3R8W8_SPIOL|nr:uncharacterized protein LOC130467543 [Spinacia oleracea]